MTDENGTAGRGGGTESDDAVGSDDSVDSADDVRSDGGTESGSNAASSPESGSNAASSPEPERGEGAPDLAAVATELAELREELDDIDDRTVEKPTLEAELKRYVRARMRRGRARGWGPYLVLLYGTVMTVAAFRFLDGWFAIGAMIILFLSTLGLYVLFVLVGLGLNLLSVPRRAVDAVRRRR